MPETIAPTLTKTLNSFHPVMRRRAIQALQRSQLVQGDWRTEDGDCFWVIMCRVIGGIPRDYYRDPVENTMRICAVTEHDIEDVIEEWDSMPRTQLDRWIASLRADAIMTRVAKQAGQGRFELATQKMRELVTT